MQRVPSNARPPRIFYGWVIVLASFVMGSFASGLAIWAPSFFVLPMREELGWSTFDFFLAFTIRSVVAAFIAPFVGPYLDTTNGPRILGLIGVLAMGASMIGTRWIGDIPALDFMSAKVQFYLLFGVLGAFGFVGSGFVIANAVLPKWFVRKRGRALGIAHIGTGFGPFLFPSITQLFISLLGWRDAWVALGLVSIIVQLPFTLALRGRPEDMGLRPDGAPTPAESPADGGGFVYERERSYTRSEVLRMQAFWFVVAAVVLAGAGFQGFQPNWAPYLLERGFGEGLTVAATSVYGAFSSTSRIVWGVLAERFEARKLLIVQSLLAGSVIFILIYAVDEWMVIVFMVLAGLSIGGYFILQPLLVASYFGRRYLGGVNSALMPFNTFSSSIAPILIAGLRDLRGDYFLAFLSPIAAWWLAATIVAMSRPPYAAGRR